MGRPFESPNSINPSHHIELNDANMEWWATNVEADVSDNHSGLSITKLLLTIPRDPSAEGQARSSYRIEDDIDSVKSIW